MTMKMDLAKQQSIAKIWLVLQEIQEKVELTNDVDATINLPVIPTKQYLREFRKIFGEEVDDEYICQERAEILNGLEKRDLIMWEDEFPGMIRFTTTHLYDDYYKDIEKQYTQIDSTANEQQTVFQWQELKLDLSKGTLQYGNSSPIDVSPSEEEIMFLALLMKTKRIVEYTEIARELKMNCYHPGATNEDLARNVQYLRRDIVPVLEKIGMPRSEIKRMIVSIRNKGYKLRTK